MSTKSDWQHVNQQLMADQRARLGDPPTSDELLAYMRGELSEAEEERIRDLLVCYPELARSLAEPFPEKPGFTVPAVTLYRSVAAIAAAVALLFGFLLWRNAQDVTDPRVSWKAVTLMPDGSRGVEQPIILKRDTDYLLAPAILDQRRFAEYRVDLVSTGAKPERVVWSGTRERRQDDTFVVDVQRSYLKPGRYQLVVYGIEGSRSEQLARYSIRVP
ncbi:MAG TPA: hypothetical protein VEO54_28285 [Thermoanaerobaculia bacterium]|nr:hypothetical protein [Thermoanaerobaculia bacterium]